MKNVLDNQWERNIVLFGVMFVALGILSPNGIVTVIIATYQINPALWMFLIIAGMFLKVLANDNILQRVIGVLPYTVYVVLAWSLWFRGITGLLQSQILYAVIWVILCEPLARDIITKWRGRN